MLSLGDANEAIRLPLPAALFPGNYFGQFPGFGAVGLSPLIWPCLSTAPGLWGFFFGFLSDGIFQIHPLQRRSGHGEEGAVPVLPPCADSNLGPSRDGIVTEFINSTFSPSYLIVHKGGGVCIKIPSCFFRCPWEPWVIIIAPSHFWVSPVPSSGDCICRAD